MKKSKLLLHICCIGCGAYISRMLQEDYDVSLFFCNPNIFPESEYRLRLEETEKIASQFGLDLIIGEYDHDNWLALVKGLEKEPERGGRCVICYHDRLKKTAEYARKNGFDAFTTTLTVSPYKDALLISRLGKKLAEENGLIFLDNDFKKQDGFKKACDLSKELKLYRQNYCGCEFSRK